MKLKSTLISREAKQSRSGNLGTETNIIGDKLHKLSGNVLLGLILDQHALFSLDSALLTMTTGALIILCGTDIAHLYELECVSEGRQM
ncbi:hypothetical protein E1301_Tti022104 [Triplophysa tibetana]|uniref:Uncharacterized protein n=1 Tax=Triplophysa tibetana TaxID=1572043 RepID=A0A5A9PLT0_9TELE|nr:hypothetical protein E1301_Tti022104 [Triplophysa tibetana]